MRIAGRKMRGGKDITVGPAEPRSGRDVAQIPEEQAEPEEGMLRDQHESKREDRV